MKNIHHTQAPCLLQKQDSLMEVTKLTQIDCEVSQFGELNILIKNFKNKYFDHVKNLQLEFNEELLKEAPEKIIDDTFNFNYLLTNYLFTLKMPDTLKKLNLSFLCCIYLEDRSIIQLAKFIPEKIEELELNFFNCKLITDTATESLILSLPAGIKKLSLNFGDCPKISKKFMFQIIEYLKLNQNLTSLEINFSWHNYVKNKHIIELFENLPLNLESLVLNFGHCKQISSDAIITIRKKINDFEKLDDLQLNFNSCIEINVKSSQKLIKKVKDHTLKNASIKFNECFGLNQGTELYIKNNSFSTETNFNRTSSSSSNDDNEEDDSIYDVKW